MYRASPYNKRIELTARGRHVGCLRNRRAGSPTALSVPASAFGPCSQLIRVLYGPNDIQEKIGIKAQDRGLG